MLPAAYLGHLFCFFFFRDFDLDPQLASFKKCIHFYFLAALGLHCCTQALFAASGGYSLDAVLVFSLQWLLLVAEHRL